MHTVEQLSMAPDSIKKKLRNPLECCACYVLEGQNLNSWWASGFTRLRRPGSVVACSRESGAGEPEAPLIRLLKFPAGGAVQDLQRRTVDAIPIPVPVPHPTTRTLAVLGGMTPGMNAAGVVCLLECVCGGGGGASGPHAHRNTARQATDGLWTEARGHQKQSNDPGNNQHILNTPIIGRR